MLLPLVDGKPFLLLPPPTPQEFSLCFWLIQLITGELETPFAISVCLPLK